ncbi:hypothetical protein ACJRO7_033573 [Eucalyptus globulus]|uniref:Uncharacterized protein n=1 Tax=Eucalyptus globulus TaxID=34317 RepID=A0ABD3JZS8_EUCGL
MAPMQEAMKEKGSAVKRQELPLHPPQRGRIKRLVFACLFRNFKALVSKISGFLLGRNEKCAPTSNHKSPPSSSLPRWGCRKKSP